MKNTKTILPRLLLAAAIGLPFAAHAEMAPPAPAAEMAGEMAGPEDGPGPGGPGGPGPGPRFEHGRGPGPGMMPPGGPGEGVPPFLRDVELSEAQDDKVFAILHAQTPMLREQHKIVEKSYEALHEMARSGKYDDAKAVQLTQAAAQAMATLTLTQVRSEQQLLAVLTAEQRKQLDQRNGPPQRKGADGHGKKEAGAGRPVARK